MRKRFEHSETCIICDNNDIDVKVDERDYPWNHVSCLHCGVAYQEDVTTVKKPRVIYALPCNHQYLDLGRDSYLVINRETGEPYPMNALGQKDGKPVTPFKLW